MLNITFVWHVQISKYMYKKPRHLLIQWNTKCAVSLANQLRAVADAFRP